MLGGRDPLRHLGLEFLHRHAGERRGEDLLEVLHREPRHGLAVSGVEIKLAGSFRAASALAL